MDSFWDFLWFIVMTYLFVAYLMALFWVLSDLFRDRGTGGFVKALWTIALIVLPVLTLLVYLIARGKGHTAVHETGIHGGPSPRVVGAILGVAAIFGSVVLLVELLG